MSYNLLKELREKRESYSKMIEFCCDGLILANYYAENLANRNIFLLDCVYSGDPMYYINEDGDYIEEYEEDCEKYITEIYQYFIIDANAAERFKDFTNEIIFYIEEDDIYILGVTHCGTSWDYVPSNWKEEEKEKED